MSALQKGNALPPGVELARDTFDRVGPLEGSWTQPVPTHQWKADNNGTARGAWLMHTDGEGAKYYDTPHPSRQTSNGLFHGPWINIGNHAVVPGAKTSVRAKVRRLWSGRVGVAFGVHFVDAFTFQTRFISIGWDPNYSGQHASLFAAVWSSNSSSSGTINSSNLSGYPDPGDWLIFTWDASGKAFSIYNETKARPLMEGDFLEYNTTIYEGPGIALIAEYAGRYSLAAFDEIQVFSGVNRPDAGWIERGTAVEETAVVRKSAGTAVLELWENGTRLATLGTHDVTAEVVVSSAFDARLLADRTGAGLELRVRSTAGSSFDIGAVEWDVRMVGINATELSSSDSSTSSDLETLVVAHVDSDAGAGSDAIMDFLDGERLYKSGIDTVAGVDDQLLRNARLAKLPPDAIIASDGTGVVGSIQEDPDSPNNQSVTEATTIRVSFPSPDGDLQTGEPVQKFRLYVRPRLPS